LSYIIFVWIGALISTFIITRILLWVAKRFLSGNQKIFITYSISLILVLFLSSIGLGTGSFTDRIATIHISISEAMINNLPPLTFLLLIDLWREKRRSHNK